MKPNKNKHTKPTTTTTNMGKAIAASSWILQWKSEVFTPFGPKDSRSIFNTEE